MGPRVLIIGAGMAGLVAAGSLAASGAHPIVVDKSRAVGGRMASRRFGGGRFDHGAQHFSARSETYRRAVDEWRSRDIVAEWFRSPSETRRDRAVEPRLIARGGMRNLPEALAAEHEIHLDTTVTRLEAGSGGITAIAGEQTVATADAVIITPPAPQMLDLLDRSAIRLAPDTWAALEALTYDACLAVLATLDGPAGLPDGHRSFSSGPIAWIADNQHKEVSPIPAITIHSSARFAAAHLDDAPNEWVESLVAAATPHVHGSPVATRGHRWRYAMPRTTLDTGCMSIEGPPPIVLAGEVFAGARVEGAFLSGSSAAETVLRLLGAATQ